MATGAVLRPSELSNSFTITCNVPITRRKSYYMVHMDGDEVVFTDRHLWPCVAFLDTEGITEYQIRPFDYRDGPYSPLKVNTNGELQWQN